MRLDSLEFLVGELSGLVENLRRDTDLADVVKQCDVVESLNGVFVIAEFLRQHDRVFRHTGGMTIGVLILHINNLCECFDDLTGQLLLFLFLLQEFLCLAAVVSHHHYQQEKQSHADTGQSEPGKLIHRLYLDDAHAEFLCVLAFLGIADAHDEFVFAAAEVGVIDGNKLAALDGCFLAVKALQTVGDLGINQ